MNNIDIDALKKAVSESISIAQAFKKIGMEDFRYRNAKKLFKQHNIDTSHFLGQSHCKGTKRNISRTPIEQILVKDSQFDSQHVKRRIIKEKLLEYKCAMPYCNITDWHGSPITLHMDHINGINDDNRLENLRLLCPNCHSQTSTYCGRNVKKPHNMKKKPENKCIDCYKSINEYSTKCRNCASKEHNLPKISWPETSDLITELKSSNFVAVGKKLGVSDNAIRRRLRTLGYDPKNL